MVIVDPGHHGVFPRPADKLVERDEATTIRVGLAHHLAGESGNFVTARTPRRHTHQKSLHFRVRHPPRAIVIHHHEGTLEPGLQGPCEEQRETNEDLPELQQTAPVLIEGVENCLLYTSPSPRDRTRSRMPSSA